MDVYWYMPAHKDTRYLGHQESSRPASLGYLTQIAQALDQLGYGGVLIPTGRNCEDAWVTASCLIPATTHLKFIVAVRPGLMSPSVAARMAASFDRYSDGRLLVNVVIGGDPAEQLGDGLFLDHDARYAQADEFLEVWSRQLAGADVSFRGDHIHVEGARAMYPPVQQPHPPLMLGGSSPAGRRLAGKWVDTYMTWGEPPDQVAPKLEAVRAEAELAGRELKFAMRLHLVVRETDAEAWAAADDLIKHVDDDLISQSQAIMARTESEGQRRMVQLNGGSRSALEISPNLWAGVGLVTAGAGTALVGSPETIAERLAAYEDLGIELFILSGFPHLEEAYRAAELLFPLLPFQPRSSTLTARVIPAGW